MKHLLLAIILFALLALPAPAYADIAPPAQPPGVNPEPGDEATQVRMLGETVLLDVSPGSTSDSLGRARVTADFTMRNLGNETEHLEVRFPISARSLGAHMLNGQPDPADLSRLAQERVMVRIKLV